MRTIWLPSSWRSDERATWTMPSGDQAWDPSASFSAGTPKSTRAGTPAPESRRASFTSDSTVCWTTPGQRGHGLRSVDALTHEEGRDQVLHRELGLGKHLAQHRRAAQAAHPSLGEAHSPTRYPSLRLPPLRRPSLRGSISCGEGQSQRPGPTGRSGTGIGDNGAVQTHRFRAARAGRRWPGATLGGAWDFRRPNCRSLAAACGGGGAAPKVAAIGKTTSTTASQVVPHRPAARPALWSNRL